MRHFLRMYFSHRPSNITLVDFSAYTVKLLLWRFFDVGDNLSPVLRKLESRVILSMGKVLSPSYFTRG